jgi:hypothetical protein
MSRNNLIQLNMVEGILKSRTDINLKKQYLIQWEGSDIYEATWENEENLSSIKNLIDDFERRLKNDNKEKEKENKNLIENIMESLEDNIPSKVSSCRMHNGIILCYVEFSESSYGIIPEPCYVPNKLLKEYFPKILIDFYETKLYFVNH